ncbi:anti-sigma factor family protein [Janthinobacterium sp. HLX7-2]|uniref:anti-sigma factor family protein n=1 Tax=Janthinobacterium sp. HLX7-2 TaxID=1259331 RepID=UPI003F25D6E6
MSSFSDETLMAYADGELDDKTSAAVARAIENDGELAARVRHHQALRVDVFAAFVPIVEEAVPARLSAAAAGVVDLQAARATRLTKLPRRRWEWPEWGSLAATLLIGVLAGSVGHQSLSGDAAPPSVVSADGALFAHGPLATTLSEQLASAGPSAQGIRIGVSFIGSDGNYCRSFIMGQGAGLACRQGARWQLPLMAQVEQKASGVYQQAGNAVPAAVNEAIDARIAGQTLDAQAEQLARRKGWQR